MVTVVAAYFKFLTTLVLGLVLSVKAHNRMLVYHLQTCRCTLLDKGLFF